MPLPVGVTTCTFSFGTALSHLGTALNMTAEIVPTTDVVWGATGQPLVAFTETVTATPGTPGSVVLPHVDQTGFKDSSGAAYTMWAYSIRLITQHADGSAREVRRITKAVQPMVGQATADLDLLPSGSVTAQVSAPVPAVTSVNGGTGAVTVAALTDAGMAAILVAADSDSSTAVDRAIGELAGGVAEEARLLSLTDVTDPDCFLYRADRSSVTAYWLGQHIGNGRYWANELFQTTPGGGTATIHSIRTSQIFHPTLPVTYSNGAIAYSGAGWVPVSATYSRTETAGESFTWTTPAAVTGVGLLFEGFSNGGLSKVEIDGSATRATMLPTAQQLVDGGTCPSSILISGGGYFAPTDRVLDAYVSPATSNTSALFASDLAAGVHTVKVTYSGMARTVAGAPTRLYITACLYSTGAERASTASMVLCTGQVIVPAVSGSVFEYAMTMTPTGASTSTWLGNNHGHDNQTALTFTVGGAASTPANLQCVVGTSVVATRTSELFHPDTGATKFADVVGTYTVDGKGLLTDHSVTWRAAGQATGSVYVAMFPVAKSFDYAANPVVLSDAHVADDDQSTKVVGAAATLAMWQSAANYVATMHLVDKAEAVNDYAAVAGGLPAFVQDRSDGLINKAYMARTDTGGAETVVSGTVWRTRVRRSVARMPVPAGIIAARRPAFGTAAGVDVASSGDASATQAVLGSDTRITSPIVADGSVTTAKVADGAITPAKLSATPNIPQPSDQGLVGWSYDPAATVAQSVLVSGTAYTAVVPVRVAVPITSIVLSVVTAAGSGLTAGQSFAALYQGTTLLGVTADQSTAWTTTGTKVMPLVGGPVTPAAGLVRVVWWSVGTTPPTFARGATASAVGNAGQSSGYRFGTANTGLTTTPPNPLGALTVSPAFWAAVA